MALYKVETVRQLRRAAAARDAYTDSAVGADVHVTQVVETLESCRIHGISL
jgi:hypothetical protein